MQAPNTVTVIDGASNRVIDEIVTGLNFQIGLAVNEFRNLIYVATLDNGVDVIDGNTDQVITNIPVDGEPVSQGINPRIKSVYVSNQKGWVSLLDEDENDFVANIQLGRSNDIEPEGVADNHTPSGTSAVAFRGQSQPNPSLDKGTQRSIQGFVF